MSETATSLERAVSRLFSTEGGKITCERSHHPFGIEEWWWVHFPTAAYLQCKKSVVDVNCIGATNAGTAFCCEGKNMEVLIMARNGSLKFQIVNKCPGFQPGTSKASKNTMVLYKKHAIRFAEWCKKTHGLCSYDAITEDIVGNLNAYSKWLQEEGKTAATIHTYIAGCCAAWQIPMDQIQKPTRHCYENTRSRGVKASDQRSDSKREASPRLYDMAEKVGLRRHDYLALRGSNLVFDESGYLCVEVVKGKGGKYQLQRILPEDEEFVREFFSGKTEYIFTKQEMKNKIDLHAIRGEAARRTYQYYMDRLQNEPGYRQQLEQEIEARWNRFRDIERKQGRKRGGTEHDWNISVVRGKYYIRGKNRKVAISKGLAVEYDRCAVMAVSVFHLSHWRCDVTIDNYLLAL